LARSTACCRGASAAAEKNQAKQAVQAIDRALDAARSIQWSRNKVLRDVRPTWYRSWYPRVSEANGRKFLHEVDDVKDHLPDRTTDMSYLVYREMLLPFGEWADQIRMARNQYAQGHQLPVRNDKLDWKDVEPLSGSELGVITLE
jgi:hexosaminidase